MNVLSHIYICDMSGELHTHTVLHIKDDVAHCLLDGHAYELRGFSQTPEGAYRTRSESLLRDIRHWGGAIARAEVILNRIDRSRIARAVAQEKGFTKHADDT